MTQASNQGAVRQAQGQVSSYQSELRDIVNQWFKRLEGKSAYELDAEIAALILLLQNAAQRHYKIAYQIGLNDQNLDEEDLRRLDLALASNLAYLQNSFAPALKRKISDMLDEELPFEEAIAEARDPMLSRIALYAGSVWVIMNVAKSAAVERKFGRNALNEVSVRRVLDPQAQHCDSCPPKAGEYSSWNEMLLFCGGLPADGSDDCYSNCRCRIEVMNEGNWSFVV